MSGDEKMGAISIKYSSKIGRRTHFRRETACFTEQGSQAEDRKEGGVRVGGVAVRTLEKAEASPAPQVEAVPQEWNKRMAVRGAASVQV